MPDVIFRPVSCEDDISALTLLLHKAYARLGDMGLNYTAVDQTDDVTRARIASGECYVAYVSGTLVGTVTYKPITRTKGSTWLDRDDVAALAQLAVDPEIQGFGIGKNLINLAEGRARQDGAREIALDTAEPAQHLRHWYLSLGYRFIEYAQWSGKTYRSVIMSKQLMAD